MGKKVTTVNIDEDKQTWLRIRRKDFNFSFSDWINTKLDELIPQADLLLIRERRLKVEQSVNSIQMAQADKYGATK